MDNKPHIKMLIDKLLENNNVSFCGLIKEKCGGVLLKVSFSNQEIDLSGEGTRNANSHIRIKSEKHLQRDITRVQSKSKDSDNTFISSLPYTVHN